jgi:tetratricopeptide (TPR) repeat protein
MTSGSALRQALAAVDLAYTEPPRACRLAQVVLAAAGDDHEPASVAERALGMAQTALGELAEAEPHLRTAIGLAEAAGLPVRAAEARGSLAYLLTLSGRSAEAFAEFERAAPALHGPAAAKLRMLRALVLTELGRFAEAVGGFDDALGTLADSGGDPLLEGDIRNNRGLTHIHRRDWAAAEDDLNRAEELYLATGHLGKTATVYHNRGWVAAVRGDLPAALSAYDEAARRYHESGRDPGLLPIERAEALLSVLLIAEARRAAELAVVRFTHQRNAVDAVQARLLLARAALLDGDLATAGGEAEKARRSALRQQRPGWAALASYLALRARWEGGEYTQAAMRSGRRAAAALSRAGWVTEAVDAQLIVARIAIEVGQPELARRELAEVDGAHRDGSAQLRARAWHARALLRLSEGDSAAAERALLAGMRVLEQFRASLGATELRVHASGHAGELARTGMRHAMDKGDPASILLWAERWRAGALMHRPARPADDAGLALGLAELRQVVAEIGSTAALGGDTGSLLRRQAALEEEVRRRSRRAGARGIDVGAPLSVTRLREALGRTALVEYFVIDGELHAIVVTGRRVLLRHLGTAAPAESDLAALRHGMRRLAYEVGSALSLSAAAYLVEHKAKCLDAVLLEPLLADIGDAPLVIVPTGALHAMPWAALPSCAGRAVSVAPSAALWHRAATTMPRPATSPDRGGAALPAATGTGTRVFASGPGLPHAAAEVVALARRYPDARRFTGRNARVDAVTRALDGADLAHIAAHGHFRADNPLFSSIQLIDGPLTVYDLESLTRPPRHVVLSACESGLPAVHPGDELLGLAAALLAMGTKSLVATVVPVPDDASRPLMLHLHRFLREGKDPAAALALAQTKLGGAGQDGAARVAANGFLCFGAG